MYIFSKNDAQSENNVRNLPVDVLLLCQAPRDHKGAPLGAQAGVIRGQRVGDNRVHADNAARNTR